MKHAHGIAYFTPNKHCLPRKTLPVRVDTTSSIIIPVLA